jgi:YidC/Oxa1 family membrane protein insertase
MDKSTRIGYILMFLLFIGFFYVSTQNQEELENQEAQEERAQEEAATDSAKTTKDTVSIVEAAAVVDSVVDDSASNTVFEEKVFTLKNDKVVIDFTNKGGVPKKVDILEYKRYDSTNLILFEENNNVFEYSIPTKSGVVVYSTDLEFLPTTQSDSQLILSASIPGGGTIEQSYTLAGDGYAVDYDLTFTGLTKNITPRNPYVELNWKSKIQRQEKSLDQERDKTSIYYKYFTEDGIDNLSETSFEEEKLESNVHWISFKQKFFNQTLIATKGFDEGGIKVSTIEPKNDDYVKDLEAKLYLPVANDVETTNMKWFFGPNHYQTLKKEKISLDRLVPMGWSILRWVNKGVIIPIFNFLEKYIDNYGIIILLLTLFIKMVLIFPMFKVYQSSAKMKVLKPELDAIKEAAGGDAAKAQQAQMKLYKQAGVSPLGGCLPQLVQFPILFAMFYFFPASIELRQEALLWCSDLSTYDSIYNFPNGFSIPFYGDHVSLFTLLMTAVTLAYTFMNSAATGQMQGPMKMVMYIMPIMFLGFFNNYAAALSFYYFLSTSITILQNFFIRKFFIDEDKLRAKIEKNKKKKVSVKKSSFQKRLEKMAKDRGVDLNNPGKKPPKPSPKKKK